MKNIDAKLESLGRRQSDLRKRLSDVSDEISSLLEVKVLPEYEKLYADTYWAKRNGSGKESSWPVYTHAKAVKRIWDTQRNGINCTLICNQFEEDNGGRILIRLDSEEYYSSIGESITKARFERACRDLLGKLRSQL